MTRSVSPVPSSIPPKRRRRNLLRHLISLALGLALFGLFVYLGGLERLQQLGHLRPFPLLMVFLATLGITTITAIRWGTLANAMMKRRAAPWHAYHHYFLVSRTLGFLLPRNLTDLGGRALSVSRLHKVALSHAGSSVVLDRMFDVFIGVLFFLAVLPYWLGLAGTTLSIMLIITLTILGGALVAALGKQGIIRALDLVNRGIKQLYRLPGLRKRTPKLLITSVLEPHLVLRAYLLSIAKFGLTVTRFICITLALDISIDPLFFLLAMPLGQFSYLVAFTPGGLGIYEAGWFGLLKAISVPTDEASLFLVGQRVLILACILLLTLTSHVFHTMAMASRSSFSSNSDQSSHTP